MQTQRNARRARRGFTLLEVLIAISLMSLIFLGAMDLLVGAGRATVRTQAQVFATGDAANAVSSVIGRLHEAQSFALPVNVDGNAPESGWVMPTQLSAGSFQAAPDGVPICTAIEVTAPPVLPPAEIGYKPGIPTIRVQSTSGGYWPISPYQKDDAALPTATTLIYRGDADCTPDPRAGTTLWQYAMPANGAFTPVTGGNNPNTVALCKTVASAPNAVQFVRPVYSRVAEKWQVEVKIISGYYSPINGQQTSEEGDGSGTSQLSGKCAFMRDHMTGGTQNPDPNARNSNNVFRHH